MTDTLRESYIAGLRELADMLEANPNCPLPYDSGTSATFDSCKVTFYCHDRDEFDAFRRAFPGTLTKKVDDSLHFGFELHGSLSGLHLFAAVKRDEVCRRVVTGTREVLIAAVPAQPEQPARVEIVEDVEWVCEPLLANERAR